MKNYLRFLSPVLLLLAVLMGGGKSVAQTATLTFTKACNGTGADDKKGTWTIKSDAKESTFVDDKGIHYGTKDVQVSYIKASTTAYSTKVITKIVVNASAADNGSPKVKCTIGGETFGTEQALTNTNEAYTFTGKATGDITVEVFKTKTKKALYLKSIEVTYDEGKTTTSISFPTTSYTFDLGSGLQEFTNAATLTPSEAGSVNYSVDKEWVDIDNGFFVVQTDEAGTATVTASFAGNESYAESSATFTINVVKPEIVEDGIFDFSGNLTYGSGVEKTSDGNFYINEDRTWTAGNVKMVTSGKYRLWEKTNGLRFYGGKLTLSVPYGYIITNVILTGTEAFDVDCGTLNGLKWIGASPSIVFTSNNNGKDLTSITVKYTKLESLTPAASGYATYAADYAVNYSEQDLKAYTVKVATDNSKVSATPFTGVVPAGKAVLVKGTAGQKYTLTPATTAADETFDTDLLASDGTVTADGAQHFAFGTKNGVSGFKLVKSGVAIPAKKGYLLISNAGAKEFFAFEGETTGISTVETAPATDGNVYNMAGQRVSKSYKGLVIVGGKKYLNK